MPDAPGLISNSTMTAVKHPSPNLNKEQFKCHPADPMRKEPPTAITSMKNCCERVASTTPTWNCLLIGDPNLGPQGYAAVSKFLPQIQSIIWKKGDKNGKEKARCLIRSCTWDLVISFYSDLVLLPQDLAVMKVAINIHPARPELPGVGYDSIPLIEEHTSHGATLHVMNEKIDDGEILHVLELPLVKGTRGKELRLKNQQTCLLLLEWTVSELLGALAPSDDSQLILDVLRAKGNGVKRFWSTRYVSTHDVKDLLRELKSTNPNHPVFL